MATKEQLERKQTKLAVGIFNDSSTACDQLRKGDERGFEQHARKAAKGVQDFVSALMEDPDEMEKILGGAGKTTNPSEYVSTVKGEKIIVGRCPVCSAVWDFPIDDCGQISRIPDHDDRNDSPCLGSGEKPHQITVSHRNGFNAKSYLETIRVLPKILAR